ncbi:hypothetical protein JL720_8972 [Aureococcus anophagefferens]|nr:hypothetical protein JL720_8972 [Aureococcus anophagefferens]
MYDGNKVTISNDGATIMKLLDIVHPAARVLAEISMSQDSEVGDGTTSVVLLAGEMLKQVKPFAIAVTPPEAMRRKRLEILAGTALNSKLIANYKDLFAPMVADAIMALDTSLLDLKLVGVKKVPGGSVTDSFAVQGVAFKKTFSYAGFEQMTKSFENCKVLCLNVELELKSEKENAEYFADRGLFCAGRVPDQDMERVVKATGAVTQTSVLDLTRAGVLGRCALFEEKQVGNERYNVFTGCPAAKTATIVLRGGSEQFIEESHRSIHDALMIAKRGAGDARVVGGGGAVEMELSRDLRAQALEVHGKDQLIMLAIAKALEIIPTQLAMNSGFDPTDVLNALRKKHADDPEANLWYGVDCDERDSIQDTMAAEIWEPALNKANSIYASCEAACLILKIDETVRNPRSQDPGAADKSGVSLQQQQQRTSAAMGGRGMAGMMGRGGRGVRRLKQATPAARGMAAMEVA